MFIYKRRRRKKWMIMRNNRLYEHVRQDFNPKNTNPHRGGGGSNQKKEETKTFPGHVKREKNIDGRDRINISLALDGGGEGKKK